MKKQIKIMGLGLIIGLSVPLIAWCEDDALDLADTAEAIRDGKIDVGKDYSMHKNKGRYHLIHSETLGMECEACHVSKKYAADYLLVSKAEEENRAAGHGKRPKADVVDRGVCLGCHKTNGVAHTFFQTADK